MLTIVIYKRSIEDVVCVLPVKNVSPLIFDIGILQLPATGSGDLYVHLICGFFPNRNILVDVSEVANSRTTSLHFPTEQISGEPPCLRQHSGLACC